MCKLSLYDAGHSANFRNYLEYWKPTYKIYEKNILEQKINVKKKIFKDEYKPTREKEEFLK